MGFFDKVKKVLSSNNFKYLDELIQSGVKEIVLDSDISLGHNEKSKYPSGIRLTVDDLVIDGNGHSIDACQQTSIFYCNAKNITIKNIILKNGSNTHGGAINIYEGNLKIIESTLTQNHASNVNSHQGGAIYNSRGDLCIVKTAFIENTGGTGGAVYNDRGKVNIIKSTFTKNTTRMRSGESVYNKEGNVEIDDAVFDNDENIIHNGGHLLLKGKYEFGHEKAIINNGHIIVPEGIKDNVDNSGLLRESKSIESNQKDFNYLNDLIHNGNNEIKLENDIILDISKNEHVQFKDGIKIDRDELEIDGDGHAIDAQDLVRIFHTEGKNITIKNITLKNGFAAHNGGAISNNGVLSIEDCVFSQNTADRKGSAVDNDGNLSIIKSTLNENNGLAVYNRGELTITESTLKKNNGGAMENDDGNLSIFNSILDENTAENGGAIYNSGKITISRSSFANNISEKEGAAIYNYGGELNVSASTFTKNQAKGYYGGGAIYNSQIGETNISDSKLSENSAERGGAINNSSGIFKIVKCEISKNKSPDNIIFNDDYLELIRTNFNDNLSSHIIYNNTNSNLNTFKGDLIGNHIDKSVIFNRGKSCTIEKTIFENNDTSKNIFNHSYLTLIEPKINDEGKTIFNEDYILIKKSSRELENIICNEGTVEFEEIIIPEGENFDFSHLDAKIHECTGKEIILDEDITFENYERDYYEGGIELDIDNLIIDGNGKCIDGAGKTRIFIITGNNITLKNITFKNGQSHNNYKNFLNNNGGAIKINNNIKLSLINCKFINNSSEEDGGSIYNYKGELDIIKSTFIQSKSKNWGGAIYNMGSITLTESSLNGNLAESHGGAIENNTGQLVIKNSSFNGNFSHENGGVIQNFKGRLSITDCEFNQNRSKQWGGAIHNVGDDFRISDSKFSENAAFRDGGAIYNFGKSVNKSYCSFINNRPNDIM